MASNFPSSIDSFINPTFTKVNGVDYVKAEHINDLQDAARNIQITIAGSGLSMGIGSNNYLPEDASVKSALEILDGSLKVREDAYLNHIGSVMATDPFQHHSNVIEVTAIGNLSSTRAQQAFEEHQVDINAIMSGGYVEGFTLDDRYILSSGSALITGSLNVQEDITGLEDAFFGTSLTHSVNTSGDLNVGRNALIAGALEVGGDLTIPETSKIGAKDSVGYTNMSFSTDGIDFNSVGSYVFTLDADDSVDGQAYAGTFQVKNGLGLTALSITEDGILSVLAKVAASFCELSSHIEVGSTLKTRLEQSKLDVQNNHFLIRLDSDSNAVDEAYIVTRDGDLGNSEGSTALIMKAMDDKIIAGNPVLKRGIQEKGYFGMKFFSDNAGGKFQGYGVNFKTKMLAIPSSISLTIDPTKSSNYNNVSITDLNEYGFFVECDSLTTGHVELKGTYETVGN
jgi:hypothetical protein